MFEDVPPEISKWVGEWAFGIISRKARAKIAVAGATAVIRHHLGQAWLDRITRETLAPENRSRDGNVQYRHLNFTVMISETLFLLRNSPAFPEICRRLKTRDVRSAYYEMYVTRSFLRAGYQINARQEIGTKGSDFDFAAVRGSEHVNVEVTALDPKPFAEVTLTNALNTKRTQLPNTAPAVIFVVLPEQWDDGSINLNAHVKESVERFLAGTQRINAVGVGVERHVDDLTTNAKGIYAFILRAFFNARPRIAAEGLISVFNRNYPVSETFAMAIHRQAPLDILDLPPSDVEVVRDSDFFRWIDYLCDRSGFIG